MFNDRRFHRSAVAAALALACAVAAAQTAPTAPGATDNPAAGTNPPPEDRNSAGAVVQEQKVPQRSIEPSSRAAMEPVPVPAAPAVAPAAKPSGKARRIENEIRRGTDNRV